MDKPQNFVPDELIVSLLAESVADRDLPDAELGKLLLGITIAAEAKATGLSFDEISEEHKKHIIEKIKRSEATKAENSTFQIALHKAAAGDPTTAGRLIREHMIAGARNMAARKELRIATHTRLKGPRRGGAKTAHITKALTTNRNKKIREDGLALDASGNPRETNSKLASRFGLSSGQIRRIRKNTK